MSVGALLCSPLARPYFERAILMSGACSNVLSRDDAERFVWFMRATRGAESSEGICTTRAMPPSLVQKTADAEGLGVTVIGSGRVDLSPGRRDADVLGDMREIGGEQSLWEFAQWTRRELEEARKPPPPTISY